MEHPELQEHNLLTTQVLILGLIITSQVFLEHLCELILVVGMTCTLLEVTELLFLTETLVSRLIRCIRITT